MAAESELRPTDESKTGAVITASPAIKIIGVKLVFLGCVDCTVSFILLIIAKIGDQYPGETISLF